MRLLDFFKRKTETRAGDPSWTALQALSPTGAAVNARAGESLGTVFACVQAISSALASLPAYVYRRDQNGRDVDEKHPLARLIAYGPNPWQTWPDFVEWLIAQVLLRGNGLAEIITDNAGRVAELRPIPWEWCSVQLLKSGRLVYDVNEQTFMGGQGRTRRLLQHEVLHLKDRSDDGLVGRSRLQRAAAVFEAGLAVQESAAALHRNGLNPSGAFKLPGTLNEEQRQMLRKQIEVAHSGASNRAKFLILDQGLEWQGMSISPEDAELLASRRFSTEELARIFQVPPPLVGIWDHSTFTNSETAGKWFAVHTLQPWARKLEAEFSRSVFSTVSRKTHSLELDLSGFLRGDHQTRWNSYKIAVETGILTTNEIRLIEGWNRRAETVPTE